MSVCLAGDGEARHHAAAMDELKVKGSHLLVAEETIDLVIGAGTYRAAVAATKETLPAMPLPGSWYDVEALNRVLVAIAARSGRTVESLTTEIAKRNARDLTTIYRVFLKVAAPLRVLGFGPQLWRTYCRFGEMHVQKNERGQFAGDCTGIPPHLVDWTCGAFRGFIPAAVVLAGGHPIADRIVSRAPQADGLVRIEYELEWK